MSGGASVDPKWIENEIEMLEKTLAMYQIYATGAKTKPEQERWKKDIAGLEHRLTHAKERLEKARKQYALRVGA
jgi:hypothetical protein